jgi:hypothetical protein
MEKRLNECVSQILAGEASVASAQDCLANLTRNELQRLLPQEGFQARFEAYKKRHHYQTHPLLEVPDQEAAAGWERIMSTTAATDPPVYRFRRWLNTVSKDLYDRIGGAPLGRWGLVAALLFMVLLPVMHSFQGPRQGLDEKGALAEAPASLQYALVGPGGKLLRPDRIITESDTLAFRIEAIRPGFVSIHIAHAQRLDPIIGNQLITEGTHDLNVGYALSGNRGPNTLIMLFADAPVELQDIGKHDFLIEAVQNGVTSMTIEGNAIHISSQQIEVQQDRGEEK